MCFPVVILSAIQILYIEWIKSVQYVQISIFIELRWLPNLSVDLVRFFGFLVGVNCCFNSSKCIDRTSIPFKISVSFSLNVLLFGRAVNNDRIINAKSPLGYCKIYIKLVVFGNRYHFVILSRSLWPFPKVSRWKGQKLFHLVDCEFNCKFIWSFRYLERFYCKNKNTRQFMLTLKTWLIESCIIVVT